LEGKIVTLARGCKPDGKSRYIKGKKWLKKFRKIAKMVKEIRKKPI
jgi:hypothetical protein